MRTHQRRLLARLAKTLDRGSWRKQTPLHRSNQAQTRLPFVRWSDSPGESKYHPPHPTVMQRLARIDDQLRFRGYSVVRIGLGILLVAGGAIYALREDIRDNVADEVSTVATRSLSDENVQQKAQQLSKALLQELLNDETIRVHAVNFVKDIFSQQETVSAVVQLLAHVLKQQESRDNLVAVLKHILSESLKDEQFRQTLALYLRYVLENNDSKEGLVHLIQGVLDDERVKEKFRLFCQETIASEIVKQQATTLGRDVVEQIVADAAIQKKTGDGLWQAISYSLTPRWFGDKLDPASGSAVSPTTEHNETYDHCEGSGSSGQQREGPEVGSQNEDKIDLT